MMKSTWNSRHLIEKLSLVADVAISISESGLLVSFVQLTLVNFRFYVQATILDI